MTPHSPAISIVTATYNRSRVLRCTIEAILRQRFTDWELLVVGDACTDDTAAVVASFEDARIRYVELARNTGEQAGPNNVGIALATAPLIAFCNHDVVWLPDHLQVLYETMLVEDADMVFGVEASIAGDAPLPLRWADLHIALFGVAPRGRWTPSHLNQGTVPASTMLFRADVLRSLHGWRRAVECHSEPSQDLMFRAWRAGHRLRGANWVTCVTAPSGFRPGSYVGNQAEEQEWLLRHLDDPDMAIELAAQALETNAAFLERRGADPSAPIRALAWSLAHAGIDPRAAWFRVVRHLRRGDYVEALRRRRGLPPMAAPGLALSAVRHSMARHGCSVPLNDVVEFAAGAGGARHLAAGWSRPDAEGVWNDGPSAELMLKVDEMANTDGDLVVDLWLRPFLGRGGAVREVDVTLAGAPHDTWRLGAGDGWHRRVHVPCGSLQGTLLQLGFHFRNTESPSQLGLSDDPRQLAMGLLRMQVTKA